MDTVGLADPVCPKCLCTFTQKRKNQRYCSRPCQKSATNNAARGSRTIAESPAARRTRERRKARVKGLSDALYETPPRYRAEYLQRLIAMARRNSELRRLVTKREMLRSWVRDEGTGRLHIAHVLDHYCREVYARRSYEVMNPQTVLAHPDEFIFPAEYFGPDAPPVYEDGCLKQRPCPWSNRIRDRL